MQHIKWVGPSTILHNFRNSSNSVLRRRIDTSVLEDSVSLARPGRPIMMDQDLLAIADGTAAEEFASKAKQHNCSKRQVGRSYDVTAYAKSAAQNIFMDVAATEAYCNNPRVSSYVLELDETRLRQQFEFADKKLTMGVEVCV